MNFWSSLFIFLALAPMSLGADFTTSTLPESTEVLVPTAGTDKTAVLVHGFNGSPAVMRDLATELQDQGYFVLNITLPGHGTKLEDMKSVTYRDWLNHLKRHLSVAFSLSSEVYVVGHSIGGALALLASHQGSDITAMLLLDPAIYYAPHIRFEGSPLITCGLAKEAWDTVEDYFAFKHFFGVRIGVNEMHPYPDEVMYDPRRIVYQKTKMFSACEVSRLMEKVRKTQFDSVNFPGLGIVTSTYEGNIIDGNAGLSVLEKANLRFELLNYPAAEEIHHGAIPFRRLNPRFDELINFTKRLFH